MSWHSALLQVSLVEAGVAQACRACLPLADVLFEPHPRSAEDALEAGVCHQALLDVAQERLMLGNRRKTKQCDQINRKLLERTRQTAQLYSVSAGLGA